MEILTLNINKDGFDSINRIIAWWRVISNFSIYGDCLWHLISICKISWISGIYSIYRYEFCWPSKSIFLWWPSVEFHLKHLHVLCRTSSFPPWYIKNIEDYMAVKVDIIRHFRKLSRNFKCWSEIARIIPIIFRLSSHRNNFLMIIMVLQ